MADQSLVDYIKKCKGLGRTDAQVRSDLIKVGWDIADIDSAFLSFSPPPMQPPQATRPALNSPQPAQPAQQPETQKPAVSPLDLLPGAKTSPSAQPAAQQSFPSAAQQAASSAQSPQQALLQQPLSTPAQQTQSGVQSLAQQPQVSPAQQTQQPKSPASSSLLSFLGLGKKQPAQPGAKTFDSLSAWQQAVSTQQTTAQPAAKQPLPSQPASPQPQQPALPTALGAQPKKPPYAILAAALFLMLILLGAYMFVLSNKPNAPLQQPQANATQNITQSQSQAQNATAQQPQTQPSGQNASQSQTQQSPPPPPPPPPTTEANQQPSSPSSQEPPIESELPKENQTATQPANQTQQNQTAPPLQNQSAPQPPSNPPAQQNSSSQQPSQNSTNVSQNVSYFIPPPGYVYPIRTYRDFGDEDSARRFCYSIGKNFLRAHYYEYIGDYCHDQDFKKIGDNWTFDYSEITCRRLPCCIFNKTTRVSRVFTYFQCDSDP